MQGCGAKPAPHFLKQNTMSKKKEVPNNELTAREALMIEQEAINTLHQVGMSVKIPDFVRRGWMTLFREKVSEKPNIKALPGDVEVVETQLPNPKALQDNVTAYVADVRIRPLMVDTIDMIRSKFIDISLCETDIMKLIESNDGSLLKYSDWMCEVLAVATINEGPRAKRKDLDAWRDFFKSHLSNSRLYHLTKIVVAMLDTASFIASIRLVAGVGTTAPRSTERIEQKTSKD